MINWLERMIWVSLSASVAGLVAILACRLPRISPLLKLWLCRLASLKFVAALVPASVVSLYVLPPAEGAAGPSSNANLLWLSIWLFCIWVLGTIIVLRHVAHAQNLAMGLLEDSSAPPAETALAVGRLRRDMGQSGPVGLRISEHLSQPCVCSSSGPTILLPADFDPEAGRHILAHEIAHVRHRDLLWGRVQALIYALFWFHPVVAWLETESRLWQEVAADAVARDATRVRPKDQADSIVRSLAGLRRVEGANVVALGQQGAKETLSRRIRALYESRNSKLAAFLVIALATMAFLPVRVESRVNEPERSILASPRFVPADAPMAPIATRSY